MLISGTRSAAFLCLAYSCSLAVPLCERGSFCRMSDPESLRPRRIETPDRRVAMAQVRAERTERQIAASTRASSALLFHVSTICWKPFRSSARRAVSSGTPCRLAFWLHWCQARLFIREGRDGGFHSPRDRMRFVPVDGLQECQRVAVEAFFPIDGCSRSIRCIRVRHQPQFGSTLAAALSLLSPSPAPVPHLCLREIIKSGGRFAARRRCAAIIS